MIFLDVGAHEGQTLEEATKERHGFRQVHAFEPMPREYQRLVDRFGSDPRVLVWNFGLADAPGILPLYGDNAAMDATLYPTKRDTVDPTCVTECAFVEASAFLRSLPDEPVVVKLNCEGGEIRILDNLIDTGAIRRIHEVMIDFDIRKVDGYEHEEQRILGRLGDVGFDRYVLSEDVMTGETHQDRIANWLDGIAERRV